MIFRVHNLILTTVRKRVLLKHSNSKNPKNCVHFSTTWCPTSKWLESTL